MDVWGNEHLGANGHLFGTKRLIWGSGGGVGEGVGSGIEVGMLGSGRGGVGGLGSGRSRGVGSERLGSGGWSRGGFGGLESGGRGWVWGRGVGIWGLGSREWVGIGGAFTENYVTIYAT